MMKILDKHFVSHTYLLKIQHGLGDNILLISRFSQNITEYLSKNGFVKDIDFNLYTGYGNITLSSDNEHIIFLAKLVLA